MEMKDVLEGLGMVDMFDDGKADFSGMSGDKELFVANVYHRSIKGDCGALKFRHLTLTIIVFPAFRIRFH